MSTEQIPSKPAGSSEAGTPRPTGSRPQGGYRPGGPSAGGTGSGYASRGRGTGGPMGAGGPGGRGRPAPRRRMCRICMERTGGVDWKAANFLRNFITERGKILSARSTGTCARCQRQLTQAIKRARNLALVPTSPF